MTNGGFPWMMSFSVIGFVVANIDCRDDRSTLGSNEGGGGGGG